MSLNHNFKGDFVVSIELGVGSRLAALAIAAVSPQVVRRSRIGSILERIERMLDTVFKTLTGAT